MWVWHHIGQAEAQAGVGGLGVRDLWWQPAGHQGVVGERGGGHQDVGHRQGGTECYASRRLTSGDEEIHPVET